VDFAEPQEIIGANFAGQTKLFRARSDPLAGHALALIIIIPNAQVFLKVFLGVFQAVLRLGRDHAAKLSKVSAHFVYQIHLRAFDSW
jgi:hypothetical protein